MSRTERITSATRAVFRMMSAISYSGFTELAPTVTPFAPAFFFAAAIATTAADKLPGLPWWLTFGAAFLVGFFAAYGLESSAFMSFGSAMKAHRHFGWKALLLPAAYLAIGITALWVVEEFATAVVGTALFLLAAVVYASRMVMIEATARDKAAKVEAQQAAVVQAQDDEDRKAREREDREWQRQQQALDRQLERQLEADKTRQKHEENLAKIAASQVARNAATSSNGHGAIVAAGFTDWRTIPLAAKHKMADMSTGEIRENNPAISPRTARDWKQRADELAAKVPQNGHVREAT